MESSSLTRTNSATRVYGSNNRAKANAVSAIFAIAREIHQFRSHIGTIFASEFRNTYRGTVLGVFWSFALPLVPVSVYILLVSLKVFPQFERLPPAVYISFNVTLWMLFVGMISRPIQVVKQRTQESMKTSLPLSAAISSSFAQLVFDSLIRLGLVAALIVVFGPVPSAYAPLFIVSLFVGVVFCLSIGLILAVFNMVYPDIDKFVGIFLQYAIFLSGVIFPIYTLGPLAVLEDYNPFNVFIKTARDIFFFGASSDMIILQVWAAISVVLLLISGRFFYVMEHRIREAV